MPLARDRREGAVADSRADGVGQAAVLPARFQNWLLGQGVSDAILSAAPALGFARVHFGSDCCAELADIGSGEGDAAVMLPAAAWVAWSPRLGCLELLRGTLVVGDFRPGAPLYANPLEWLQKGRRGAVIVEAAA